MALMKGDRRKRTGTQSLKKGPATTQTPPNQILGE
jgi:hypothetical protein